MLRLGQQEFVAGQFAVMAIVNRTPDSFYDGGANVDLSRALDAAERAVDAGADMVNDTWAGADPALVEVAASTGAGLVCSHTGGLGPRTDPHRVDYADV